MSGQSRKGRIRPARRYALLALYQFDSGLAGDTDAVREALESSAEIEEFGESPDMSTAEARMAARDPDAAAQRAEEIQAGLDLAAGGDGAVEHEREQLGFLRGEGVREAFENLDERFTGAGRLGEDEFGGDGARGGGGAGGEAGDRRETQGQHGSGA